MARRFTLRPPVMALTLGVCHLGSSPAVAQQAVGALAPTAAECQAAAEVLSSVSTGPGADEAWNIAVACPDGGQYIADVLRASTQRMDSVQALRILAAAGTLRDGRLASAANAVAADRGSVALPRAVALIALTAQWRPGLTVPPDLLFGSEPEDPGCVLADAALPGPHVGTAVSATLGQDIQNHAASILADASTDLPLRRAAQCVFRFANTLDPPPFLASGVRLTYLCRSRFQVRNTNFAPATLTYEVYGTPERGPITVGRATPNEPQRDVVFSTANVGTVRLFVDGTLIQSVANGGKPTCP